MVIFVDVCFSMLFMVEDDDSLDGAETLETTEDTTDRSTNGKDELVISKRTRLTTAEFDVSYFSLAECQAPDCYSL